MITAIGIFYQIEQTTGDLRLAIGFGVIPGVMWILGARFVANRQDTSGHDTPDSNAK